MADESRTRDLALTLLRTGLATSESQAYEKAREILATEENVAASTTEKIREMFPEKQPLQERMEVVTDVEIAKENKPLSELFQEDEKSHKDFQEDEKSHKEGEKQIVDDEEEEFEREEE